MFLQMMIPCRAYSLFVVCFRVLVTGVLADRRPASLHFFRNFDVPDEHYDATHPKSPFTPPPKPSGELHSSQTQKPTSHPVVSVLKICVSSKRLRSEVRKKSMLETQ